MTKEETLFESIGSNIDTAERSQMFGKPCYKVNGKAFVCFFQQEMVFKLNGTTRDNALALSGAQLFDPSGKKRPMKEWIQVPFQHKSKWEELARAAYEYVGG